MLILLAVFSFPGAIWAPQGNGSIKKFFGQLLSRIGLWRNLLARCRSGYALSRFSGNRLALSGMLFL